METKKKQHITAYSVLGVVILLLFGLNVHQCSSSPKTEYITSPPTRIHDTIIRDSIQIQEKTVVRYVTKDVFIYDTIVQIDSLVDTLTMYVPIPIEHKSYRDFQVTDTCNWEVGINYSGYKASLDSVWFNYSYVPKEIVKPKERGFSPYVGVSLNIGYGAVINTIDKTFVPGPYLGIGVSLGWGYHWKK